MKLRDLDFFINDLKQKFDDGETEVNENEFLLNLTNDLIELMHEHGVKLVIDEN